MTTAHTLQRSIIVGFAAFGIVFALTGTVSAETSAIPDDVVVVSSTTLESGSFMMTVTNIGALALDLNLAAPGDVSTVSVDFGSYDGRWTIDGLEFGTTATMTGVLRPWIIIA